jgi:hypothetical protein
MVSVMLSTRPLPESTALINLLQDRFPLDKVLFESWRPAPEPPLKEILTDPKKLEHAARFRMKYYAGRLRELTSDPLRRIPALQEEALDRVFGDRWKQIEKMPPSIEIADRDWSYAAEVLKKDPPDILLVFGNSLLPDTVTQHAKLMAINIHTGLSPHYRGRGCTEFAIINEDFENIGVTVHIVRKQIDGGEILQQARPDIVSGDTEFSIELKNRRLGFLMFREIVERAKNGERPRPATQPKDVGLLLLGRAFTEGHARLLRELVAGGAVERYVERKANGKIRPKPILEELQMFKTPAVASRT